MGTVEDSIPAGSPVAVVRAMWLAQRQGRIEDMLALVHPEMEWRPMTRPGRSVYVGHDGTRQMMADIAGARGDYRVDWSEILEQPDGSVLSRGRVVTHTDGGEVAGPLVEAVIRLRDGLVVSLEGREVAEP